MNMNHATTFNLHAHNCDNKKMFHYILLTLLHVTQQKLHSIKMWKVTLIPVFVIAQLLGNYI